VELGIAAARIAAGQGERSRAEDILSRIVAENPGERGAALLLLELKSPVLSPESYRTAAWKLFDRYPADREVFNTLFSSLLGARDWEGASVALAQHDEAVGGGDPDNLQFHGLVSAMRGDLTSASKSFRTAMDFRKDGIARYDLALVTLAQGGIAGALELLGTAREECAARFGPERKKSVLSQIDSLTGTARALAGDPEGARKALANAVILDPGNLRAWLLMRKLEAQTEQ
jgi:tetratricopeptide (TPR) repeat protein